MTSTTTASTLVSQRFVVLPSTGGELVVRAPSGSELQQRVKKSVTTFERNTDHLVRTPKPSDLPADFVEKLADPSMFALILWGLIPVPLLGAGGPLLQACAAGAAACHAAFHIWGYREELSYRRQGQTLNDEARANLAELIPPGTNRVGTDEARVEAPEVVVLLARRSKQLLQRLDHTRRKVDASTRALLEGFVAAGDHINPVTHPDIAMRADFFDALLGGKFSAIATSFDALSLEARAELAPLVRETMSGSFDVLRAERLSAIAASFDAISPEAKAELAPIIRNAVFDGEGLTQSCEKREIEAQRPEWQRNEYTKPWEHMVTFEIAMRLRASIDQAAPLSDPYPTEFEVAHVPSSSASQAMAALADFEEAFRLPKKIGAKVPEDDVRRGYAFAVDPARTGVERVLIGVLAKRMRGELDSNGIYAFHARAALSCIERRGATEPSNVQDVAMRLLSQIDKLGMSLRQAAALVSLRGE